MQCIGSWCLTIEVFWQKSLYLWSSQNEYLEITFSYITLFFMEQNEMIIDSHTGISLCLSPQKTQPLTYSIWLEQLSNLILNNLIVIYKNGKPESQNKRPILNSAYPPGYGLPVCFIGCCWWNSNLTSFNNRKMSLVHNTFCLSPKLSSALIIILWTIFWCCMWVQRWCFSAELV